MKKMKFYGELSYLLGLLILALGTALMEKADFGMSMVVAPAYLIYLKVSQSVAFFTFGMAEYLLQAVLLVLLGLVLRQFKVSFLFSFVTAVLYGICLDLTMALLSSLPAQSFLLRAVLYAAGTALCSMGVSLLIHTYLAPEAYELFVKKVAEKWKLDFGRCKTVYDCVSCGIAILLSFAFFGFGHFEGVKWGTILCALINGTLIGGCSHLLESRFDFPARLPIRQYFE